MDRDHIILRMNLGNSLRFQEKLDDADEQYRIAINEMREQLNSNSSEIRQSELGQALVLRAEVLCAMDSFTDAEKCLLEAETLFPEKAALEREPGLLSDYLEFHAKAQELYRVLANTEKSFSHVNKAIKLLEKMVSRQSSVREWESILGHWVKLHGARINNLLQTSTLDAYRQALVTAESSKGRILHWGFGGSTYDSADEALDEERQVKAVDNVIAWCRNSEQRRYVVSFYADLEGLAVFIIEKSGDIKAHWENSFAYLSWLKQRMNPMDIAIEQHNSYAFSAIMAGILSEIGNVLWRLFPELLKGGDELIILPHKALRNLPLQHIRMPDGNSLGELFQRVYIYPTLWEFNGQIQQKKAISMTSFKACVDPDDSLPFARLEGWLCCEKDNLATGKSVTKDFLLQYCNEADLLLLSCHGFFDPQNAWQAAVKLSDGWLKVVDFILQKRLPEVIVLGACETGLSRRSAADEPIGFSGILLRRNVKAVIAPLWPVDDFASALFMTACFDELQKSGDLSRSVLTASHRLRKTTVKEARNIVNQWMEIIQDNSIESELNIKLLVSHLSKTIEWLNSKKSNIYPFASPIDWAAFQLVGGYQAKDKN